MQQNFWEQGNLTRVNFSEHINLFLGNRGETPIFSGEQGNMHPPGRPSVLLKCRCNPAFYLSQLCARVVDLHVFLTAH